MTVDPRIINAFMMRISCDEKTKENSAVTLFYLWVLDAIWWSKMKLHVKLIRFFTKFYLSSFHISLMDTSLNLNVSNSSCTQTRIDLCHFT